MYVWLIEEIRGLCVGLPEGGAAWGGGVSSLQWGKERGGRPRVEARGCGQVGGVWPGGVWPGGVGCGQGLTVGSWEESCCVSCGGSERLFLRAPLLKRRAVCY